MRLQSIAQRYSLILVVVSGALPKLSTVYLSAELEEL